MYKNLREIAAVHKKTVIQSRLVVPKKHFYLVDYCINFREQFFFSECRVSLFYKSSCGQPFLNGTCNHNFHIYNVFDRYFHLRSIVILKEYLQPYI